MNNPPQLHVLHIASGDLWAGAEVQLYTLARTLHNSLNTSISVVLLNHGTLELKLKDAGVQVTVLDESQINTLRILQGLSDIIRNTRPDVVHTHRIKENILGSVAAYLSGRTPSIRTVHGASEYNTSKLNILKRILQFMNWFSGRFLQSKIISVSDELAGRLRKYYPKSKIIVIENGIDIALLRHFKDTRNDSGIDKSDDTFRIGFAGRLVPVKRVDLFIETAAHILNHKQDQKASFHIFGEGPMRNELEILSHKLGVSGIVKFEGHKDDLYRCLSNMNVLLITSDHEGLPMILLEAIALEMPIVSHAVGGIPKVLEYGHCGILVDKQDPSSYASGIYQLMDSPDFARNISKLALDIIKEHYTADRNALSYLHVYRSIINFD